MFSFFSLPPTLLALSHLFVFYVFFFFFCLLLQALTDLTLTDLTLTLTRVNLCALVFVFYQSEVFK